MQSGGARRRPACARLPTRAFPLPAHAGVLAQGDVVGCLLDADAGEVAFTLNGASLGPAFALPAHVRGRPLYPVVCLQNAEVAANFGAAPFAHAPPTGYVSLADAPAAWLRAGARGARVGPLWACGCECAAQPGMGILPVLGARPPGAAAGAAAHSPACRLRALAGLRCHHKAPGARRGDRGMRIQPHMPWRRARAFQSAAVSGGRAARRAGDAGEPELEGAARVPVALILEPARDLAEQTHACMGAFAAHLAAPALRTLLAVGGGSAKEAGRALEAGVDVITGTPGAW